MTSVTKRGDEPSWWQWWQVRLLAVDLIRTLLAAARTLLTVVRYSCAPWWGHLWGLT